jgi:protein tyrosine/serine phosphatase
MRRRQAVAAAGVLLIGAAALIWGPKFHARHIRGNFREVVPGVVYRSAKPTASQLSRWQAQYGLKTVINLRGVDTDDYADEKQATAERNLKQIDIAWPQGRLFTAADVRALLSAYDESPRPVLVHCAGGVDRSGAVGVITAMSLGGKDYCTAKAELKSAYWGLRDADDWATGRFLEYEAHCHAKGIDTGGWAHFLEWLETVAK